jgi:hypothetical protein
MAAKPTHAPNRPAINSWTPPTGSSVGPTQCREVLNISLFGAKASLQHKQRLWMILVHGPRHYILVLVVAGKCP